MRAQPLMGYHLYKIFMQLPGEYKKSGISAIFTVFLEILFDGMVLVSSTIEIYLFADVLSFQSYPKKNFFLSLF